MPLYLFLGKFFKVWILKVIQSFMTFTVISYYGNGDFHVSIEIKCHAIYSRISCLDTIIWKSFFLTLKYVGNVLFYSVYW